MDIRHNFLFETRNI